MRAPYLHTFCYADFKIGSRTEEKPAYVKVWLATAYVPVLGTISQVALLALSVLTHLYEKDFRGVGSFCGMFALRVALTLAPPLLFTIDMITTLCQVCINKKSKMCCRVEV
ncbi:MAG: hypothetical protein ACSNEK_03690 [Parachlamydiaceae bacterium]